MDEKHPTRATRFPLGCFPAKLRRVFTLLCRANTFYIPLRLHKVSVKVLGFVMLQIVLSVAVGAGEVFTTIAESGDYNKFTTGANTTPLHPSSLPPLHSSSLPPLQIVSIEADAFTARFTLPELQISHSEDGTGRVGAQSGATYQNEHGTGRVGALEDRTGRVRAQKISFEGADWTLEAGKPRVPIYTQLIGIPVVGTPIVTVIRARPEVKTIGTVWSNPADSIFPDTQGTNNENFYPQQLVEVVPGGFVREQRIASLQINPVQYNPATGQLKIFSSVEFRIHFPGVPLHKKPDFDNGKIGAETQLTKAIENSGKLHESMFQSMLLNYTQAKPWRKQRRIAAPAAPPQPQGTHRFKIPVTQTDLYHITYNKLKAAGVEPETINLHSIRLESGGQKQGLYIFDENQNQTLDNQERIIFYGRGLVGNKFTDENVYWLSFTTKGTAPSEGNGQDGSVAVRDATPRTPNLETPSAFLTRARFEENVHHDVLAGTNIKSELADHYFWATFRGGNIDSSRKDFPVELPGAAPRLEINRKATLRIKFQGASRRGVALHRARIAFNGRQLGRIEEWKRQASPIATRDFEQRFIHHNQVNFMRIEALDENKTPPGAYDFYLDWYEFDYWRSFRAERGKLEFNSTTEPRTRGTVQYRITNMSHDTIDVYQLGAGGITSRLVGGKVTRTGATYQIVFEDVVNQHTRYFVINRAAYRSINALVPTPPTSLKDPASQADYIVITHPTFTSFIQPLVEFRRSQGLTATVVEIQDIYDEFSDGLFNPLAIQKFLRYAYTSWQPPAPTYVVLVGDAHYDYKNATVERYRRDETFRGTYNLYPIFVPTYHGWAPASGETAMDQRFVNISGDDALPDMLIGRLSVQTPEALATMVEKIINYERNLKTGPWQGTLIQVADDNTDNPGDGIFEISRNELIQEVIPVGYNTREIYLRKLKSPALTGARIRSALNQGAIAIEYAGHGGSQTWADESIFRSEDVVALRNRHLPFVITTTCLNGQFDKPQQAGNFCLSEQFLLGEHGAIAALSATRLTYGSANAEFDRDLFKSLFGQKPATVGKIVGEAKIRFISRIRNQQWIPGTEQYTLFGDPASQLALPQLDIRVRLERIALNDTQEIVIQQNEVGTWTQGGEAVFNRAADFSTEALTAFAVFANNFDDNLQNDIVRRTGGRVWQGEYGTIRIAIPNAALPGGGIARLFAFDAERAAIGGTRFWVEMPVVRDVRETLDIKVTDTLNISALIVDDKGAAGIKNISVLWDDTATFKDEIVQMVKVSPTPISGEQVPLGGQWYELQTPIPLPQGGRQVRYRILITDTAGHNVAFPSKTERRIVKIPEGPNIAIDVDRETKAAPLRYQFSEDKNSYQLIAELVNNGGRPVLADIEVVFSEGDMDVDADSRIDEDADILGKTIVRTTDWEEGTEVLQRVTVAIELPSPLATGVHKIYVLADADDANIDDKVLGTVHEARVLDNKRYVSFVVNEFNYKSTEELTAFSLDRVFDIHFPAGAVVTKTGDNTRTGIPLSVNSQAPETLSQPDIQFAPIPRVAALRRGLIRQGRAVAQRYEAAFRTGDTQLEKPAQVKLRFDVSALEDRVRESTGLQPDTPGFKDALTEQAAQLAIYAWRADFAAWRRLPSEITYGMLPTQDSDTKGGREFLLENYVTPTQMENASEQALKADNIRVNSNLTPAGKWVILFQDSSEYVVFLRRKGEVLFQKLDKSGQLDNPFREEGFGLELLIPSQESTPLGPNFTFEFADILAFETDYNPEGDAILTGTRNHNLGNGNATVNSRLGPKQLFEAGDWFLFFTAPEHYEVRDAAGEPVHLPNGVKVRGKINESLFLSHLGLEIFVNKSSEDFGFGDKIKFSSARVGTITAEVTELTPFALMRSEDTQPPEFAIWVDGIQPQTGSVIPPRPKISIVLQDTNGIDPAFLSIAKRKDSGPLELLTDYEIRTQSGNLQTVPIAYQPILFPGEYTFEIRAQDFNANALGGDAGAISYRFFVTEEPDITPPLIEMHVNESPQQVSTSGTLQENRMLLSSQPHFEIVLTDDSALDDAGFSLALGSAYETLVPLDASVYSKTFDPGAPDKATVAYAPDLPNGEYHIRITAADTSENIAELEATITLEEAVALREVFNVPNPTTDGKTFFTYHLAQTPDTVTIKIYTIGGRLIRTILDASAKRGSNETRWDGRDEIGTRCANGVYLYRVIAHTEESRVEQIGKLAILR